MISASDRENAVLLINEAIASGASCKKACWTVWIVNFNTSHVTVYLLRSYNRKLSIMISIHLMLRFIARYAPLLLACGYFNTSHVTVYHVIRIL